jgi:hypothetical protein
MEKPAISRDEGGDPWTPNDTPVHDVKLEEKWVA